MTSPSRAATARPEASTRLLAFRNPSESKCLFHNQGRRGVSGPRVSFILSTVLLPIKEAVSPWSATILEMTHVAWKHGGFSVSWQGVPKAEGVDPAQGSEGAREATAVLQGLCCPSRPPRIGPCLTGR